MFNRPEDVELDEVALPFIIKLYVLDTLSSLRHFVLLNILLIGLFSLLGQVNLILDILMSPLRKHFQVGDSINAALPSHHLSLVIIHQNVFVGEVWCMSANWLTHLPDVALGPSHVTF